MGGELYLDPAARQQAEFLIELAQMPVLAALAVARHILGRSVNSMFSLPPAPRLKDRSSGRR